MEQRVNDEQGVARRLYRSAEVFHPGWWMVRTAWFVYEQSCMRSSAEAPVR